LESLRVSSQSAERPDQVLLKSYFFEQGVLVEFSWVSGREGDIFEHFVGALKAVAPVEGVPSLILHEFVEHILISTINQ